jgi:CRISPR/Cas system Type II protein with McrA/HNH and RuvC-like nuclease domain
MSKKILGLDIGTTSIGWAIVEAKNEKKIYSDSETDINNDRIGIYKDAVGVRIIAQDTERFDRGLKLNDPKGSTLTPTATRRKYRGSRRMKSRYILRRDKLNKVLEATGLKPDASYYTNNETGKRGDNNDIGKAIYELRDRAIRKKITLAEFGRILLHLNQLRGYSSDRFAKDEKPKFDYYLAEVLGIDTANMTPITDEKNKEEIKYYKVAIKLRFYEPLNIGDVENKKIIREIEGYIFKKNIDFKSGDFITIKKPDFKQDRKGKNIIAEYYKITLTTPDPTDWNYKYQTLQKELTEWCETGNTVGSYFYRNFYENHNIERIRNHVVNRRWYEQEFDKIFDLQFENHKEHFLHLNIEEIVDNAFKDPNIKSEIKKKENEGFKEQLRFLIKDKIIFFQRPWQQAKNKGQCPFEKIKVKKDITVKGTDKKETIEEYIGRTVIPRSHPLFQEFKIWQQINNVRLFLNAPDKKIDLFANEIEFKKHIRKTIPEVKEMLYISVQKSKTLTWRTFVEKELGIKYLADEKEELKKLYQFPDPETGELIEGYFSVNFRKRKKDGSYDDIKIKGNNTKVALQNILAKDEQWLNDIHPVTNKQPVSNLQLLWEIIYDITNSDANKVAEIIKKHFGFDEGICKQLANLKFDDNGMGNLSTKAIKQILPLMRNGENITEKATKKIASLITLNNSEEENTKGKDEKLESLKNIIPDKKGRQRLSQMKIENDFRYLNYWEATAVIYGTHSTKKIAGKEEITPVKRHSMNNPIVEKIVNETITIVNEIYKTYGFDEVRIELSRELKASMDERAQIWEAMNNNAEKTEWAKQMLRELKTEFVELDTDTSNKSNLDKIKIIEDTVRYKNAEEYKIKSKEYNLKEPSNAEVRKYLMWLEQNFRCPYTDQPIPFTDIFARNKVVEIEHIIPKERYYLNSYSNKVITWREVNQAKDNKTAYEFIVSKRSNDDTITLTNGKKVRLVDKDNWESHVKSMFPKGGKQANLLRKEIPEDPIERTLKETQYINKKLKEKLAELVGSERVWITSGAVTDILRDRWHLNDIMKELMRTRFEKLNTGEKKDKLNLTYWTKQLNTKTGQFEDVENFEGYFKRLDHRHHAMDAIIIACTKQNHIQYINTLNAISTADQENDYKKKAKYKQLKEDICIGDSSKKFKTPWNKDYFLPEVKRVMNEIIVSHKNTRLLISPSKHRIDKEIKPQKMASIRGELHKETNYARKNYFEGDKTPIAKLIIEILKKKKDNHFQTMVHFKSFEEIIKETVLKEKYQDILITLFSQYNDIQLNDTICKEISKSILLEIQSKNLLLNAKTNRPLEWLSTYSEKDKSNRPNGLSMNLNDEKEIKSIAHPRIKRIAGYRLKYVNERKAEIDKLDIDKKEKDRLKREAESLTLYSNALYEVRIKNTENNFEWIELKNFNPFDFDKIEYTKNETTEFIKNKLQGFDFAGMKQSYFDYILSPILLSLTPIPIKKVRQKSWFQDLYEVTPGRYVYSLETFMVYFFEEKNSENQTGRRVAKFLKFIDAISIINAEKPDLIDYNKLIEKEKTNEEIQKGIKYNLLFTLAKNDLVYLPESILTQEQLNEIDWNRKESLLSNLYIVKDMNPSQEKIVFQKIHIADAIKISDADAKSLFKNAELKELTEEIKYGTVDMLQRCIKVFTDKLGKKVVPYWEFPNGKWKKQRAEQ